MKRTDTLTNDMVRLLQIAGSVNYCDPAILAKELGRACGTELKDLVLRGLLVTEPILRRDGKRATLYSLSTRGKVALTALTHAKADTPPPVRTYDVVPTVAVPRGETWTPRHGEYDGAELRPYTGRPGANDAMALPSRTFNRLRYRDGRVMELPQGALP